MSFNYRNEMSEKGPKSGFLLVHPPVPVVRPKIRHTKTIATSGRCPHPPLPRGHLWIGVACDGRKVVVEGHWIANGKTDQQSPLAYL